MSAGREANGLVSSFLFCAVIAAIVCLCMLRGIMGIWIWQYSA